MLNGVGYCPSDLGIPSDNVDIFLMVHVPNQYAGPMLTSLQKIVHTGHKRIDDMCQHEREQCGTADLVCASRL